MCELYLCAGASDEDTYNEDEEMTTLAQNAALCSAEVLCFKCKCSESLCFVALKKKSLPHKKRKGGANKCPVQDQEASQHVKDFFVEVMKLSCRVQVRGIVWDWKDIPNDHHMHVDAAVFCDRGTSRFDIDGENHFLNGGTTRIDTDIAKDSHVRASGAGMLRLHHRDKDSWCKSIEGALRTPPECMQYTASDVECLDEWEKAKSSLEVQEPASRKRHRGL